MTLDKYMNVILAIALTGLTTLFFILSCSIAIDLIKKRR